MIIQVQVVANDWTDADVDCFVDRMRGAGYAF